MWELLLSGEQSMIADSLREYLAREWPVRRLRSGVCVPTLAHLRTEIAGLGWLGVGLPESIGGAGLGVVEEMLVQRECGRFLVSPSILGSVLAAHIVLRAGDGTLARALVAAEKSVAMLIVPTATATGTAHPAYSFDWSPGDLLLAWSGQGIALLEAESFTPARQEECLDDSVALCVGAVTFNRSRLWIDDGDAMASTLGPVLLAAALCGLAECACDITVEHVKQRQQFGKPIGAFQAVKHRCADMALRARLCWYQTALASLKCQAAAHDARLHAAAAKLLAAQAAHENCRAAVQLHGAMGFQSECDAHWLLKRAHLYDQLGGDMNIQARRVIAEPSPLW